MAEQTIDDSLYIDYNDYHNNGKTIVDKVSIINENIQYINDLISKNWESWLGEDSDTYVSSLKSFLKTLSNFSTEMNNVGNFMMELSTDYSEAVSNCVGELSENE